ncbi:MAG: phage major capsid protein [Oscillospiraceae bacterium]|nr:phage major capsid protein [Oscillospiraceae bacterium]
MNYQNLKLEKSMYRAGGKNFTHTLEMLDPSDNYKDTPLSGLDAFERQLKRFDIKVSGAGSDMVEKFFATSNSSALFPEYVSRAIRQGMEETDVLKDIIATKTRIDSLDYRSVTSLQSQDDKTLKKVAEGAFLPQTEIKTKSNLVNLIKRGRLLTASYEAIRYQKLDLFTVTLRQIGAYISRYQFKDAVDVLIHGDGNDNEAGYVRPINNNEITYLDLLNLWEIFNEYEMNTLLVSPHIMMRLLQIEEFKNPATGLNFQATGKLTTPMGANLIKSISVPNDVIVALDKKCALEMVSACDVQLEYDKLIDCQLERAAISCIAGFAKLFPEACYTLKF